MLNQRIDSLTANGIFGLTLVLIFLGLFLNIKLSAWVAFGIPFSFLGMFIIGGLFGISINMISLFGMILVVGILVDDGIVIAENIYAHFERGKPAHLAALDGTMEVLSSVFSCNNDYRGIFSAFVCRRPRNDAGNGFCGNCVFGF